VAIRYITFREKLHTVLLILKNEKDSADPCIYRDRCSL